MHRFFGTKKEKEEQPTLEDASGSLEKRGDELDKKIHKLDVQLVSYKKQLSSTKSSAAKQNLKRRALQLLKQKKLYEKQRDQIYGQQFNVDQTKFAAQTAKETITVVSAMKSASKDLQTQFKEIDIDEIEDLHDDMTDLLDMSEEVNDLLGQSYAVPDDLDETDLMGELDALDDELEFDVGVEEDGVPDYLVSAQSAANGGEERSRDNAVEEAEQEEEKLRVEL